MEKIVDCKIGYDIIEDELVEKDLKQIRGCRGRHDVVDDAQRSHSP